MERLQVPAKTEAFEPSHNQNLRQMRSTSSRAIPALMYMYNVWETKTRNFMKMLRLHRESCAASNAQFLRMKRYKRINERRQREKDGRPAVYKCAKSGKPGLMQLSLLYARNALIFCIAKCEVHVLWSRLLASQHNMGKGETLTQCLRARSFVEIVYCGAAANS